MAGRGGKAGETRFVVPSNNAQAKRGGVAREGLVLTFWCEDQLELLSGRHF